MTHNQLKKLAQKFGLDLKYITEWKAPEDTRAVIGMPNIPKPLHHVNPRNILGPTTWNKMRKACYNAANMTCEICGKKQDTGYCDAHEIYDIDYTTGTAIFKRTVCTCRLCHRYGIHTGRCITLFKGHNPLMPKEALLAGAENAFKTIAKYNKDHPGEDLRCYYVFIEYLREDELREPMLELIKKYNVKFYMEDPKKMAKWADWKLIIGSREFPTPYKNEEEWREAMEKVGKNDTARIYAIKKKKFIGTDNIEITDEHLKKIEEAEIPEGF